MACALPITDVQPLTGMRTLKTLWIDSTLVTDLRPLAGASLHTLSAIGTPLRSLAPFESNPPPRFTFESAKLSDGYLEPILARWSRDSSNADVVRGARVLRAVRTGRHLVVRSLATPFGGRRYLFLPVTLTFGEARALAGRLGGHLVTITSGDEQAFVGSTVLPKQCTAWLGIDSIDGRIGWVTHEARVFTAYASHFALRRPPPHFMLCLFGNCSWATLRSQFGYHRTRCSLVVEWEEDGD